MWRELFDSGVAPQSKWRPMMPLTMRWSVEAVGPTPTPKFISHLGETLRSVTAKICCWSWRLSQAPMRAGVVAEFDHHEAVLAAVLRQGEIAAGGGVGVVPAEARGGGGEVEAGGGSCRDHGRALFHGAIDGGRNVESVPVHDILAGAVIGDVDGDGLTFLEAQQRPGNLSVIGDGLDGVAWPKLPGERGDFELVIRGRQLLGEGRKGRRSRGEAGQLEQGTA